MALTLNKRDLELMQVKAENALLREVLSEAKLSIVSQHRPGKTPLIVEKISGALKGLPPITTD